MNSIAAGGGWKKPQEYRIKPKAILWLGLSILLGFACVFVADKLGPWIFLGPAASFCVALGFLWREKSSACPGLPDGGGDPYKLYLAHHTPRDSHE